MTQEDRWMLLTFARYEARKAVKADWKAEGLKDWAQRDLRIASERYLAEHWGELRPKAEELLAYCKAQDSVRKGRRKRTLFSELIMKAEETQS